MDQRGGSAVLLNVVEFQENSYIIMTPSLFNMNFAVFKIRKSTSMEAVVSTEPVKNIKVMQAVLEVYFEKIGLVFDEEGALVQTREEAMRAIERNIPRIDFLFSIRPDYQEDENVGELTN